MAEYPDMYKDLIREAVLMDHRYQCEDIEEDLQFKTKYLDISPASFFILENLKKGYPFEKSLRLGLEEYAEGLLDQIIRCAGGGAPCCDGPYPE